MTFKELINLKRVDFAVCVAPNIYDQNVNLMSGYPSQNFSFSPAASASLQPVSTSDSRLLDAAETLVTLQSRGGSSGASDKSSAGRSVYLTPHKVMAPQPPTSSSTASSTVMGPPPAPPPTQNNVTFVLINQNPPGQNLMRPPIDPPPRRGRGRGRGRGASGSVSLESGSSRGRGRGRGRGASSRGQHAVQAAAVINSVENEVDHGASEDIEMMDGDLGIVKEEVKEETFMVGDMELKDSIFDEILNKKKLELLMDPEVLSIFAKSSFPVQGKK